MPVEESQAAMEARRYCWVTHGGGAITIASLPTCQQGSWTVERLAHQMPDTLNYRVGAQPGGLLYVPEMWNNKEGPQAREPSKCLNRLSYRERLAKEAFWSPATRGWKKDSDRAITPMVEAVRVPAHSAPPRCLQAKQLHHFSAQLSLGQNCNRQKKSCVYMHRVTWVISNSLQPCRLWLASLLCQRRGSPCKNTGAYWPIMVAIPF